MVDVTNSDEVSSVLEPILKIEDLQTQMQTLMGSMYAEALQVITSAVAKNPTLDTASMVRDELAKVDHFMSTTKSGFQSFVEDLIAVESGVGFTACKKVSGVERAIVSGPPEGRGNDPVLSQGKDAYVTAPNTNNIKAEGILNDDMSFTILAGAEFRIRTFSKSTRSDYRKHHLKIIGNSATAAGGVMILKEDIRFNCQSNATSALFGHSRNKDAWIDLNPDDGLKKEARYLKLIDAMQQHITCKYSAVSAGSKMYTAEDKAYVLMPPDHKLKGFSFVEKTVEQLQSDGYDVIFVAFAEGKVIEVPARDIQEHLLSRPKVSQVNFFKVRGDENFRFKISGYSSDPLYPAEELLG